MTRFLNKRKRNLRVLHATSFFSFAMSYRNLFISSRATISSLECVLVTISPSAGLVWNPQFFPFHSRRQIYRRQPLIFLSLGPTPFHSPLHPLAAFFTKQAGPAFFPFHSAHGLLPRWPTQLLVIFFLRLVTRACDLFDETLTRGRRVVAALHRTEPPSCAPRVVPGPRRTKPAPSHGRATLRPRRAKSRIPSLAPVSLRGTRCPVVLGHPFVPSLDLVATSS